ncbi:MAG: hypothetical protein LLG20_27385 [Acidobacteriales bacterium]|nr:hypothetical protein [Terriglobales bacterium]
MDTRKLREALGLSQVEFGRLIGRAHQSIRNYEAGLSVPPAVYDRILKLAQERGLTHLVLEPEPVGNADHSQSSEKMAHELLHEIFSVGTKKDVDGILVNLANFVEAIRSRSVAQKRRKAG